MRSSIPIFPLNIVIYPGSKYPLHIFEERYKKLINRCISTRKGFGIVAKIDLEISKIGCIVEVKKIFKKYENGSMDILVEGSDRFSIFSTLLHSDGYLEAEFESYSDNQFSEEDSFIYDQILGKFRHILDKTEIRLEESFWKKLETTSLKSFKIAEKSGLNLKQQQNLLVIQNENDRLNYLLKHFERVEIYLDRSEAMREIISGDGYIN